MMSLLGAGAANGNGVGVPADVTPPDAPANLVATPGDGTVGLVWDANVEVDLAGYRVWRSETSGSGFVDISDLITVGTETYDDDTAVNGTTYFYHVTAEDEEDEPNVSGPSNEEEATPEA